MKKKIHSESEINQQLQHAAEKLKNTILAVYSQAVLNRGSSHF